jgi:hypothetical protein
MSFQVKNGPLTCERVVTKTFREYLDNFMKIFLDDFTMYSGMENHLQKFRFCFQKCREYGISLNLNKFAFMVFARMVLGFIVSKEGKLPYPKRIQVIVKHVTTKESTTNLSIQWDGIILQMFYKNLCCYYGTYH